MEKIQVTIKIAPITRQRLEAMKASTGFPYGILIDNMVEDYAENKEDNSITAVWSDGTITKRKTMGKTAEWYLRISEIRASLENLSLEQLRSLLPCATWEHEQAIMELITDKEYDTQPTIF